MGDPEIATRIEQYEMAYRMQTSVPILMNTADEPQSTFDLYGPDVQKPGTFAANCLLARRLAERNMRFIQLYHRDWDNHGNLPTTSKKSAIKPTTARQHGSGSETAQACSPTQSSFGRENLAALRWLREARNQKTMDATIT